MKRAGFTLLEMMISITILTTVLGVLYMLSMSITQSVTTEEAKMASQDEARRALQFIVRELRQAASQSVMLDILPGPAISYRVATDVDGNGTAVDVGGNLELGGIRFIGLDTNDSNGDGLRNQLILNDAGNVRVLANNLVPTPLNAAPDQRGFWVETWNQGFRITVGTQFTAGNNGHLIRSTYNEVVVPRN
jgi:prepilin-type N-terminal cleavage/methylation domain-containing protein